MTVIEIVLMGVAGFVVLVLLGIIVFFAFYFLRRRRVQEPEQSQDQEPKQQMTPISIGSKVLIAIELMVFLMVLFLLVNLGSCTWKTFKWSLSAGQGASSHIQQEILSGLSEEIETGELLKIENEKKAAIEEQRKKIDPIQDSVKRWLARAYAKHEGWEDVHKDLEGSHDGTQQVCVFPVISYVGVHLPPIELALAPAGTRLFPRDDKLISSGRSLLVRYLKKDYVTRGAIFPMCVPEDCIYSPILLLTTSDSNKVKATGSKCKLTINFSDEKTARLDESTRLCLEKSFWTDYDRPVKVMDLPTAIDGVPVYWDLVVRCYPAPMSDLTSRIGRWMPGVKLEREYMYGSSPSLQIRESEDLSDDAIWIDDDEHLLRKGVFATSTEEMRPRVKDWRYLKGLDPTVEWKGGNQLYVEVKKVPDRSAEGEAASSVMVRVILRVRTWVRAV
jgi:hypothetical protein